MLINATLLKLGLLAAEGLDWHAWGACLRCMLVVRALLMTDESAADGLNGMQTLAHLIVQHSQVQRWLMKIDDEHLGRGHAYLDIAELPAITTAQQLHASTVAKALGNAGKVYVIPHAVWPLQTQPDEHSLRVWHETSCT